MEFSSGLIPDMSRRYLSHSIISVFSGLDSGLGDAGTALTLGSLCCGAVAGQGTLPDSRTLPVVEESLCLLTRSAKIAATSTSVTALAANYVRSTYINNQRQPPPRWNKTHRPTGCASTLPPVRMPTFNTLAPSLLPLNAASQCI